MIHKSSKNFALPNKKRPLWTIELKKHTAGFAWLFCLFIYMCNDIFEGKSFDDMTLDELNEREDDIDEEEERIFEAYRFVVKDSEG